MPESKWSIPTADGKTIYGVLNKAAHVKNKKAILFVHGLTGDPYGFTSTVLAQNFPALGYDIIRPYLYHANNNARKLVDCTIQMHADDIDGIYAHFAPLYDDIFVIGHSLGGPSVMSCHMNQFKAICLWDPTFDPSGVFDRQGLVPMGDYVAMTSSGTWRLLGHPMLTECKIYTKDYTRQLSAKCNVPIQVVWAGNGMWHTEGESYHSYATGPTQCITIPETTHCFWEEGTTEPLLNATKEWFDRYATV